MASEWNYWYPHEIDSWQGSATIQTFTDAAYRAYHNLIMSQFTQPNGKLPNDDIQLAKDSRMGARWLMVREGLPTIAEEVKAALALDAEGYLYSPKQYEKWKAAHTKHVAYVDRMEAVRKAKAALHDSEIRDVNNDVRSNVDSSVYRDVDSSVANSVSRAESKSKRKSKRNTNYSCTEQSSVPAFTTLPLLSGETFPVTVQQFEEWQKAFPAVDVENHLQRMRVWLHEHPERMKTRKGIGRFAINWLSREQDKPQGSAAYGNNSGNRNQQRTNGNIDALRSAAAEIDSNVIGWPGGGSAGFGQRGDAEAVLSPT